LVKWGIVLTALGLLGSVLARGIDRIQESAERAQCNLGGVALALHYYDESHGSLPPAILYGKDGTPLHSWRVLILPYLEESVLYNEFHLDEPWNSPHNIQLLPRMPKSYRAPGRKASMIPPYHTVLHVFVGKGTPFEEIPRPVPEDTSNPLATRKGWKIRDDFPNWPGKPLLFVEAGEPVPWTKPQELLYDPDQPLPELFCIFKEGFRGCEISASYHFVYKGTSETDMRDLITRDGGKDPG
jgi:hypothetical protein